MTFDGVYLVPEESERELFPNRYIMNSTSGILWKGPSLLPYIFWAHIPVDENLDVLQQAVCACLLTVHNKIVLSFYSAHGLLFMCDNGIPVLSSAQDIHMLRTLQAFPHGLFAQFSQRQPLNSKPLRSYARAVHSLLANSPTEVQRQLHRPKP